MVWHQPSGFRHAAFFKWTTNPTFVLLSTYSHLQSNSNKIFETSLLPQDVFCREIPIDCSMSWRLAYSPSWSPTPWFARLTSVPSTACSRCFIVSSKFLSLLYTYLRLLVMKTPSELSKILEVGLMFTCIHYIFGLISRWRYNTASWYFPWRL